MRPAVERAAERWKMNKSAGEPAAEVKAPEQEKLPEKRSFKDELMAWGDRPRPSEPFVRSDVNEIKDPEHGE